MISIIIPTLNEERYIERTLEQFKGLDIPHEIILTDGGSTDKTLDIARRYTQKIVVWDRAARGRRQTFGEAKNMGAALASGEYLLFIDADVDIPSPQAFFTTALALFAAKPDLTGMTVPLRPWRGNRKFWDTVFCEPLNWYYIVSNNWFHAGNGSGEFQMMRADAFKKVGGYAEDLIAGEDNNMFYKLALVGRTLSYSKLSVYHSCRRPHKLGWLQTYFLWIKNGLSVALRKKAAVTEWKVIR